MKIVLSSLLLIFSTIMAYAQAPFGMQDTEIPPISWHANARLTADNEGIITITADIADQWHLYGMEMPENGPKPTKFTFDVAKGWTLQGKLTVDKAPVKRFDPLCDAEVQFWEGTVVFKQKFKLTGNKPVPQNVTFSISYMGCNDQTCLPPATQKFNIRILPKR